MRTKLSQDAWVLLTLLIILVLISIFAVGKQGTGIEILPRRTTYSTRPGGVRALYDTLDKLGYPVARRLKPLDSWPADGVLFLISPEIPLSSGEWASVREWVQAGNLLIVSSDDLGDVRTPGEKVRTARSAPVCPSFLSPGVRSFLAPKDCDLADRDWSFEHGEGCEAPFG